MGLDRYLLSWVLGPQGKTLKVAPSHGTAEASRLRARCYRTLGLAEVRL